MLAVAIVVAMFIMLAWALCRVQPHNADSDLAQMMFIEEWREEHDKRRQAD